MLRRLSAFLAGALLCTLAFGQSVPNGTITQGQIWTTAQWNTAFQAKTDVTSGTLTGPTINGGTLTGSTISNPTISGGTQSAPAITGATLTTPTITTPTVTGGTFSAPTLSSTTINGSMTLNGSMSIAAASLSPTNNVPSGSVGLGTEFNLTTRVGGFGQYGNVLDEYLVTAATPGGQFDTGLTSWATNTNLTGGQIFGAWFGANTPSFYLNETFPASGGASVGAEINSGNRWADFGLQGDVGGPRYTVGLQIVPDVVPSTDTSQTVITINSGSPCVVNWTGNALPLNTPVTFGGTGTLPSALTAGTSYYVATPATNTFEVSAAVNGSPINCATASSGSITGIPSFPGSFGEVIGASVHANKWWVGHLQRFDTIMPGGHANVVYGGSASNGNVPRDVLSLGGFWANGLDLSGASFSGSALIAGNLSVSASGTTIAAGSGGPSVVVTAPEFFNAVQFIGSPISGASFGPKIDAGTNSSDYSLLVASATGLNYVQVFGDGGVVIGAPTGGDKGVGTVNAVALYGSLTLPAFTVATLPTCNTGIQYSMAVATDATAPTYNGALTGGGTVSIPVFCNGSSWSAH